MGCRNALGGLARVVVILCTSCTTITPEPSPSRACGDEPPTHVAAVRKSSEVAARPGETKAARIDVAVTFDDLPAHGPLLPGQGILEVHRAILDVLAKHGIDRAHGFVNGIHVERHPDGRAVLEEWHAAGHPLGNHTWSHADIAEVGTDAFIAEIERNDALLAQVVGDGDMARRARRLFRYPYLRQGADRATLDAVRNYLRDHGYRLAEVTIDFGDWAYNPPFVRCSTAKDEGAIGALRFDFVRRATGSLRWSDTAARGIYGDAIPHVLLLHSGSFDAAVLDDLLTAYESAGAHWITLDEAIAHPAYREDVRVPSPHGGSLLEQIIERDAPPHPPFSLMPLGLLEHLCR